MAEYIERETLLSEIERREALMVGDKLISVYAMKSFIKNRPAADVAPVRHGRWERVIPSKGAAKWSTKVSCSNCHSAGYTRYKYCPNCGCLMLGGED